MGLPGRPPKPRELRALAGNAGHRSMDEDPPKPKAGRPPKPELVEDDPVASQEWDRVIPLIEAMRILGEEDGTALAAYCILYSRWTQAEKQVQTSGITITVVTGTGVRVVKNPAVTIAEKALSQLAGFIAEFGLSPQARSRINVKKAGKAGQGKVALFPGKPAN
ncbi:MAG: phage terminase small subunit P27 family [Dehalococcoidia bacterium]